MNSCAPARIDESLVPRLSEKDLIAAAQAGQEWAFPELCRRNSSRVFNMINRVTKNHEDAEDALQEASMKAFVHLDRFDNRSSFSTWFTRIGINSALMILRKKRVYRETSMVRSVDQNGDVIYLDFADRSLDPEQCYAAHEGVRRLRIAIDRLPKHLRTVIEIRQRGPFSMREISEIAGHSVPSVKSRLCRARAALRKALNRSKSKNEHPPLRAPFQSKDGKGNDNSAPAPVGR